MNKLFQLKRWLTLKDAAAHMTLVMSEPVQVADILQLALDGHLILSVDLVNHANGRRGRVKSAAEAGTWKMPFPVTLEEDLSAPDSRGRRKRKKDTPHRGWDEVEMPAGLVLGEDRILVLEEEVHTMVGIWDIPMIGGERIDIENMLQGEIDGPPVNLMNLDGSLLARPNDPDELWAVQEHWDHKKTNPEWLRLKFAGQPVEDIPQLLDEIEHDFIPAQGLPEDSLVILRQEELQRFLDTLSNPSTRPESDLGTKERNTLLVIIGILCKYAGLDHMKHSKSANALIGTASGLGVSVGESTIEGVLRKVDDALATRMK